MTTHRPRGRSVRWDLDYDSRTTRPLLAHGYWNVLASWSRRDFFARYSQSALRTAWSIWQPLSIVVINGLFFYGILDVNGGGLPYLSFIVASIMSFRYISTGLGACTVVVDNASILTKAYFPREVMPLATLVVSLIDLTVMFAILVVVSLVQGITITYTIVALPIVLVLLLLFSIAVTLFFATLTVFVRDLTYVVPTFTQLLFFITPIMYPTTETPEAIAWVNSVNPLAVVVEGTRDVVLRGQWPPWGLLGVQIAVNLVLAVAALWYLRSVEAHMADVV